MEYSIYADIVFLINLIMDMLVFWIAGRLARAKNNPVRLVLGSGIASALYCFLALSVKFRVYYNFFTTLAVLMIGLLVSFNPKSIKEMLKLIVFANIAAFSIGGAAFALFYYTNIRDLLGESLHFTLDNLPIKILLAATATSYILIKLLVDRLNKITVKKQAFYRLKIVIDDDEAVVVALLDTGNSLKDPITDEPVIIAEFNVIKQLLPDSVRLIFYENRNEELLLLMNAFSETSFIKRVRILPFSSLGKQNGMLIGIRPDCIHLVNEQGEVTIVTDVIVGIYNSSLADDGSFQALLNPSIL